MPKNNPPGAPSALTGRFPTKPALQNISMPADVALQLNLLLLQYWNRGQHEMKPRTRFSASDILRAIGLLALVIGLLIGAYKGGQAIRQYDLAHPIPNCPCRNDHTDESAAAFMFGRMSAF